MPAKGGTISMDDFKRVEMRVGRVVEATPHPSADKLLVLQVDLGGGKRQLVAGLKEFYAPESLVGRLIVVVTNLAPVTLRGQKSEAMLLAAVTPERKVHLVTVDGEAPAGTEIA